MYCRQELGSDPIEPPSTEIPSRRPAVASDLRPTKEATYGTLPVKPFQTGKVQKETRAYTAEGSAWQSHVSKLEGKSCQDRCTPSSRLENKKMSFKKPETLDKKKEPGSMLSRLLKDSKAQSISRPSTAGDQTAATTLARQGKEQQHNSISLTEGTFFCQIVWSKTYMCLPFQARKRWYS